MAMKRDSGWAWIISAGAFVGMFMETGMIKSFGVLLPELREQFDTYTWVIGLTISLLPGFGAVTCIIATGMKMRKQRFILIIFGAISSFGILLCSLSWMVTTLATGLLLSGFSFGAEATTFSILPVYFDQYYGIANSVSHAGLSVGVMVMPLLTQFLQDLYGFRGALLILAAMEMHIIIIGTLLRPIQKSKVGCKFLPHNKSLSKDAGSTTSKTISDILDLDLFLDGECVSLIIANVGYGYYYTGWLIYLVPHAMNLGFSPYAASLLATAGGVGNVVGSCVYPLASRILTNKRIVLVSHLTVFVSLIVDPLLSIARVYITFLSTSFILNFASAIYGCAFCTRAVEIVPEHTLHSFVNWEYVGYGIGSMLSGFISGRLYDCYGHFSLSFGVLSFVTLLTILPLLLHEIRGFINVQRLDRYYSLLKHKKIDKVCNK